MRISMDKKRGFTLIEVLVAMIIMVGAIILVSNAWSGNFMRIRKATLFHNASFLLEKKMAEIDAENTLKGINEVIDQSGDFGDEFPEYRYEYEVQPFVMPNLQALAMGEEDRKSVV